MQIVYVCTSLHSRGERAFFWCLGAVHALHARLERLLCRRIYTRTNTMYPCIMHVCVCVCVKMCNTPICLCVTESERALNVIFNTHTHTHTESLLSMHSPGFQAGGGPYGGGGMGGGGGPTSAAAALGVPFGSSGKRARTGEKASYASSIAGDNGFPATSGSAACWPHRDDYYAMHTPVASVGMVSSIIPYKNTRISNYSP